MVSTPESFVRIGYQISSPSQKINILLDELAFTLLKFESDVDRILDQIHELHPQCFVYHALRAAFALIDELSLTDLTDCETFNNDELTEWEKDLFDVVCLLKKVQPRRAVHVVMEMVRKNPFDVISMIIGYFISLVFLDAFILRDLVGRMLPFYPAKHPYRGLLEAYYGFALLESFSLEAAERHIKSALETDPWAAWTIHSNCHLLEYTGKYQEAIQFLDASKEGYQNRLWCHNNWHKALFQIGVGDKESAYEVFHDIIVKTMKTHNDVADATSLLWRLKFEDYEVPVGDFKQIVNVYEGRRNAPLHKQQSGTFFAFNFASCFIGAQDYESLEQFKQLMTDFMQEYKGTEVARKHESVGLPMIEAMQCFAEGDYERAAEKAYDVRNEFLTAGGSEAQKDFLHYLLFYALKKQDFPEPRMRLTCLLNERSGYRTLAPVIAKML